jgi:hypothetical protein
MYEAHHERLLSRRKFFRRLCNNFLVALAIIIASLLIGMFGYHLTEQMSWVDAYVNASMILSGMGPVEVLKTSAGKIFAGTYALFSGIIFLIVIAVIVAPIIHRFLHKFHVREK